MVIEKAQDTQRRGEAYFMMGGQYNLHYGKTGSLISLQHAIDYSEKALQHLPESHDRLKTYVAVYSQLLQVKAQRSGATEDVERYIAGLQHGLSLLEDCDLKEEKRCELGCAYFSDYNKTKSAGRLTQAIETFQSLKIRFPQGLIYLGCALIHHHRPSRRLRDLAESLLLIVEGLEGSMSETDEEHAQLRTFGEQCLLAAAKKVSSTPSGIGTRNRLIESLDLALASAALDDACKSEITDCRQRLADFGRDRVKNAQLLRGLGESFFKDWQSRHDPRLLDVAICFAREALDEASPNNEAVGDYAFGMVFYVQTKAISFQSPETTEEYIAAVQEAIDAIPIDRAEHDQFIQRLAWAYWARFEQSKTDEDLDSVIAYI